MLKPDGKIQIEVVTRAGGPYSQAPSCATLQLLLAREACGGQLVSALEGGYDLNALASASDAHLRALMTV